jgi:hypothetical protein
MPFHISTPLIQGLGWVDLDLHATFGRFFDLLHPGLQRMRGTPCCRGILVGERELDLLRRGWAGAGKNASNQARHRQISLFGHVFAPLPDSGS